MEKKPVLLDIMEKGRFLCQMRYTAKGRMEIIDGKPVMAHDLRDIKRFVLEQRPSLRGKNINFVLVIVEYEQENTLSRI